MSEENKEEKASEDAQDVAEVVEAPESREVEEAAEKEPEVAPLHAAAARRAKAAEGGMFDTKPRPGSEAKPVSKPQRIITTVLAAVAVAVLVYLLAGSGAGSLNVSVNSESGETNGYNVAVSLYEGDVSAELMDDDASNDPEPTEVHNIAVGMGTTYTVTGFGTHTVAVTYTDDVDVDDPDPIVFSMFGIDMRQVVTTQ